LELVNSDTSYEKRWGHGSVDLKKPTLPALKLRWIADRLPAGRLNLLDYGCGEGKLLKTFSVLRPEINAYGTDVQAPKTVDGFTFHLKKNENEKIFDGRKFDAIVSVDVLEHVPDIPTCLDHMENHLTQDGRLYFFIPAEGQLFSFYNFFRVFLGRNLYKKTKDHTAYSRKELIELVKAKFEIEEINYAYHLFGSLMDATFFAFCAIPSVARWWWEKNSIYHPGEKKSLPSYALEIANAFCFLESSVLRRVPFTASGLFIKAKKKN